ncbi:nucleotidyltransferase [Robertmurraya yapensis]|uniref:tRNA(Met) cytidine acetate ligase n=1 Tax=Bacillus yapensis TaxID=2492960 RepID=A0A3S0LCU1_9BACI|nr:nucleotidyltransferase [Bacillus yapensis]RTR32440.1 nucleotidyltransferase [Bacillus yapensis]TKS96634.1 nucleotidyltransferase [Bacillus yapensis]
MKAVGVIVEYNPFHNGHAFHLEETRKKSQADVVIAVMSGQFLQRGEPALLPKWVRAQMAVLAGVDLVIELPYQFATQKADTFAFGAISLLGAIGCNSVCFGSESGKIDDFWATLDFLESNKQEYDHKIKFHIDQGVSYPTALSRAFLELQPHESIVDLSKPNNILGFQYVKAIQDLNLDMEALTISRTNANYHDEDFTSATIASATSIRKAMFAQNGTLEEIEPYVPKTTFNLLHEYAKQYHQFHQWENYWTYLRFRILQASTEELRNIYEVDEGLENRVITAALEANSFHDFMTRIKTKRYTWTKLQRMCTHILTNTTTAEMRQRMTHPSYIRLLAMNDTGRLYLNKWKGQAPIPLVSKLSSFQQDDIALDVRASRIYALGATEEKQQALLEMEYKQPPIYISNKKRKGIL